MKPASLAKPTLKLPVGGKMVGLRVLPRHPIAGSGSAAKASWLVQLGEVRNRKRSESVAIAAAAQAITETMLGVQSTVEQRLDELAGLAVELGLHVAREIVGDALDRGAVDPTPTVIRCLRDAVHGPSGSDLVVHLHPDDLGLVLDRLAEQPELKEQLAAATIRPDPELARGAVRSETGAGRLRYEPLVAFERVAEAVRSAASGGQP